MFFGCFCLLFGQLHDINDLDDFKTHNIPRCLWPGRCCQHHYPLGHKIFGGSAVMAQDLIQRAADSGVELYLDGETLKARGSRQAVENLSPELRAHKVEIVALLASARMTAVNDPASQEPPALVTERQDPDRWSWPHSSAMTSGEIDAFAGRASQFYRRGMPSVNAEALAYTLVNRDRDGDDRRLCLECSHLTGQRGAWRCDQWKRAGMGAAGIPAGMVLLLQRCDGFRNASR